MVVVRRRSAVLVLAASLVVGVLSSVGTTGSAAAAPAAAAPPVAAAVPGGTYVPLTPTRVLDTRTGLGAPRGATTGLALQITGAAGVPAEGVAAVVLNTTVTQPSAAGFLSVSPNPTSSSSNLNYVAGQDVAQLVTSRLSAGGAVYVRSYAATHVVADVVGYFTDAAHATGGATYRGITPSRLFDSRAPDAGGRLLGGMPRRLAVPGAPTGATAVVVDLTTVLPDMRVFVTAWGSGAQPGTSNMNVAPGDIRSNRAIVPLAADGSITVAVSNGRADVIVDVSGWFTGGAGASGGSRFVALEPVRLLDTRVGSGLLEPRGSDPQYFPLLNTAIPVAGRGDLPPARALVHLTAAWLSATVVSAESAGWVAMAPTQGSPEQHTPTPGTSDVNFGVGATPNAVLAGLGTGGLTSVSSAYHGVTPSASGSDPQLVVDLVGVFVSVPQPATGLWRQGRDVFYGGPSSDSWNQAVPGATGDIVEVAASQPDGAETVAMRRDGTVLLWKPGVNGPAVLTVGAAHVAANQLAVYVVKRDGTVWTDDDRAGARGVPGRVEGFGPVTGVSDAVSIAVMYTDQPGVAVRSDGSVVAWGGRNPAARTIGFLPGPVTDVSLDSGGLACVAMRDGSVGVISGTDVAVATGIGATSVATARGAFADCYALDGSGRIHELSAAGSTVTDDVTVGLTATAVIGNHTDVMTFDGRYTPQVRVLAVDGAVWDRVVDAAGDRSWRQVTGLDGATAIGGVWSLVTWIPPTG